MLVFRSTTDSCYLVAFEIFEVDPILRTTKHNKKAPQTKEFPFLGKATMTYNMRLPEPEKHYGVDLSTLSRGPP